MVNHNESFFWETYIGPSPPIPGLKSVVHHPLKDSLFLLTEMQIRRFDYKEYIYGKDQLGYDLPEQYRPVGMGTLLIQP